MFMEIVSLGSHAAHEESHHLKQLKLSLSLTFSSGGFTIDDPKKTIINKFTPNCTCFEVFSHRDANKSHYESDSVDVHSLCVSLSEQIMAQGSIERAEEEEEE
jgi:hypothetical protein